MPREDKLVWRQKNTEIELMPVIQLVLVEGGYALVLRGGRVPIDVFVVQKVDFVRLNIGHQHDYGCYLQSYNLEVGSKSWVVELVHQSIQVRSVIELPRHYEG